MMDEKILKMVMDGGIYLASIYLVFRPIVLWMLSTWTAKMEESTRAHEYQRQEHEKQERALEAANGKLDVLVKHSR